MITHAAYNTLNFLCGKLQKGPPDRAANIGDRVSCNGCQKELVKAGLGRLVHDFNFDGL